MGRPPKEIRTRLHSSGCFLVGFLEEPEREHLSPEKSPEAAVAWARRNKGRLLSSSTALTLAPFLAGFFASSSPWATRMREKGHTFGAAYLSVRQGHLDNYIGPLFGAEDPRALGGRQIDDTLLGAPRRHGRKPLAPATKYKIMYSFALVLADLRERGIIETNPLEGIKPYSKAPIAPRGALPRDALPKLFPTTHGELVQVWSGSMWAACMLVLLETGMRPGELRALRWGELYGEERAFVVRHGIEAGTVDHVKGTKTDQVKSGGISIRTAQELTIWRAESRHSGADDFIFTLEGPPVTGAGILKAFRRGLAAVDLEAERWTPYWLRHSFITYSLDSLEDSELLMLAGHTNLTTNAIYRHPDDEIVLKRSKTAREKLDMARGK